MFLSLILILLSSLEHLNILYEDVGSGSGLLVPNKFIVRLKERKYRHATTIVQVLLLPHLEVLQFTALRLIHAYLTKLGATKGTVFYHV